MNTIIWISQEKKRVDDRLTKMKQKLRRRQEAKKNETVERKLQPRKDVQ